MTASAPIPPPPSTLPQPAAERRAPSRWIALWVAAVLAAVAGIGIGWLLWGGPHDAASGTGPENAAADAAGACQAWDRVPALSKIYSNDKTSRAYFARVGGAAALAQSAAQLDHRYDALDKAFQDVTGRLQTLTVKGPEAVAAHDKATALCARLGN
ncbi:hypothetical protein SAMN05216532_0254 [Streptomyces sp. 2231.1]|uniref:hypothetical protein n=1 Tax=Streptomyces sp. 2231.1 TaxID=1855347 RepID=UPI00089CD665|nr:hypothetical protein [Streptomyces sp. 2231.1]SEC03291.1 hypothetical protein SAMN05216532_0254 [Streptomyces sp. 2231.1]